MNRPPRQRRPARGSRPNSRPPSSPGDAAPYGRRPGRPQQGAEGAARDDSRRGAPNRAPRKPERGERRPDARPAYGRPASAAAAPPPARPTSRLPPVAGVALYGVNPVARALEAKRRTLRRLYVLKGRPSETLAALCRQAESAGISVYEGSAEELEELCGNAAHQGAVLACSPLTVSSEAEALALPVAERPVLLVLDQIEDPQNFGAIVRNGAAFGAAGAVIQTRHASPLSPAASKASAGELEAFPIFEAVNIARFLDACKERGWWVAGTVVKGGQPLASFRRDSPTVLVLGNEGRGMRPLVERHCDFRLTISARPGVSLNVASASAIVLYHLLAGGAPGAEGGKE